MKDKLYELHKGKTYSDKYRSGIVCGYDKSDGGLIIAITEGHGWDEFGDTDVMVTHQNNSKGYNYYLFDDNFEHLK